LDLLKSVRMNDWRKWMLGLACLLALGATPRQSAEDWQRQGNLAFAREDYDLAVTCYSRAEGLTTDPGSVAFNKAAALYRLGLFVEAERHYRRALENASGPRRQQALFNLGNCLLQQGQEWNLEAFEQSVRCYEECLAEPGINAALRIKVEHNLELTRLLLQKAKAEQLPRNSSNKSDKNKEPRASKSKQDEGGDEPQTGSKNTKDGKGESSRNNNSKGADSDQKTAGKGDRVTLTDQEQLVPMSAQETRALLEQLTEHIRQERRARQSMVAPNSSRVKDW
jgi:tetratricopeptide (TPR) repeat protein